MTGRTPPESTAAGIAVSRPYDCGMYNAHCCIITILCILPLVDYLQCNEQICDIR